jgi:osmotically-inducible protein OsmY
MEECAMTDQQLQENVQLALDWDPSVGAAAIGVSVDGGAVTLRGEVRCCVEKAAAERVALAVYGVVAVVNDLTVMVRPSRQRSDSELAEAAIASLRWSSTVPAEKITVTVGDRWVTLSGRVDWEYQKAAAARIVRDLTPVCAIHNNIIVEPHASAAEVSAKIEAALKRNAEIGARQISVTATNGTVTLAGTVHSWFERDQATRAAWAAPGVTAVNDRLSIID